MKKIIVCLCLMICASSCISVRVNPGKSHTYVSSSNNDDFKIGGMNYDKNFKANKWTNEKKSKQTKFSYGDFKGYTSMNMVVYKKSSIQFTHDFIISSGNLIIEVKNESDAVIFSETFSGKEKIQFPVYFQEPGEYTLYIKGSGTSGESILSWK